MTSSTRLDHLLFTAAATAGGGTMLLFGAGISYADETAGELIGQIVSDFDNSQGALAGLVSAEITAHDDPANLAGSGQLSPVDTQETSTPLVTGLQLLDSSIQSMGTSDGELGSAVAGGNFLGADVDDFTVASNDGWLTILQSGIDQDLGISAL